MKEDTQQHIGKILGPTMERDAIHIAVAPVEAPVRVYPGQHVGITGGPEGARNVGIVDPYLTGPVEAGYWYFVFLYPNTITSLRHTWTHPTFDNGEEPRAIPSTTMTGSRAWLHRKAEELGLSYEVMMENARTWLDYEEHTTQLGSERWRDRFGDPEEFWIHYEAVTGAKVAGVQRQSFYSCSC